MLSKIFNFLRAHKLTRFLFFLGFDIALIYLSVYLAFFLRFDGQIPFYYFENYTILKTFFWIGLFTLPLFYIFGLYSFSWSYISTRELIALLRVLFLSFIFSSVLLYFSKDFPFFIGFPRSVLIISYFLIFIFCGGIRVSKRIYLQLFGRKKEKIYKEKIIIIGADDAGEQVLRSILSLPSTIYQPVGFVDDNPLKKGVMIHGVKVLGQISDLPTLIKKFGITQAIITLSDNQKGKINKAVQILRKNQIKNIKIVPPLTDIVNGKINLTSLKEVEVEELLKRKPLELEIKEIENFIKNKIVLITGAAGSIGSELSKQLSKFKPSVLLLLDQDETGIFNISQQLKENFSFLKIVPLIANIRDKKRILKIFEKFRPQIVFHAAAYKHVPLMEENPEEAIKNNVLGTAIVAGVSLKTGVEKFILISSDKAVNPISVMGKTKRIAELICQKLNLKKKTKFISVRFGNVLNSRGSVIPIFKEQIMKGGPVTVTDPQMKRYFMLTSEACLLVMQAAAMGQGGEVFVLDMGKPIKILDLAREMIKLYGFEPDKDIPIIFTGKRPGEKLFEEILTGEEGTIATKHQRIFISKQTFSNSLEIEKKISELLRSITS